LRGVTTGQKSYLTSPHLSVELVSAVDTQSSFVANISQKYAIITILSYLVVCDLADRARQSVGD